MIETMPFLIEDIPCKEVNKKTWYISPEKNHRTKGAVMDVIES